MITLHRKFYKEDAEIHDTQDYTSWEKAVDEMEELFCREERAWSFENTLLANGERILTVKEKTKESQVRILMQLKTSKNIIH